MWDSSTPQDLSMLFTAPLEMVRGSASPLSLCSAMSSRSWSWTAWTTPRLLSSARVSPRMAWKVSFWTAAGGGRGRRNTASTSSGWFSFRSRA